MSDVLKIMCIVTLPMLCLKGGIAGVIMMWGMYFIANSSRTPMGRKKKYGKYFDEYQKKTFNIDSSGFNVSYANYLKGNGETELLNEYYDKYNYMHDDLISVGYDLRVEPNVYMHGRYIPLTRYYPIEENFPKSNLK